MADINKKGEIIRQKGIKNVLEELGFKENKDFIFLNDGMNPYVLTDGEKPVGVVKINTGEERPMQFNYNGKVITVPVLSAADMSRQGAVDKDGKFKYGITSGNNGVGAIYVPGQGMVLSPNYEIKDIMQEVFRFENTDFSVPLSNGEMFENKQIQNNWGFVRGQDKMRRTAEKNFSPEELEQKRKEKMKKIETKVWDLEKDATSMMVQQHLTQRD